MTKWGSCDFRQLKEMQKRLQKLNVEQLNTTCISLTNELAARLLRKVIKRTPVGQYPSSSGKIGGTLRRGWNIGEINKAGNTYEVEIINPVMYASYVEFGHRTRNHKGWVRGRFMMTISEKELDAQAPKIIEKRIMEYLEWCFNGE
jgi:hypothetical protein